MSLPNEYLKLKWIASTGTQWIESNTPATAQDIITIKGKYNAYWNSDNHVELLGCHNSGTYFRVGIIEQNNVKKFFASTGYWNEDVSGGIYDRGYPVCDADLDEHEFIYNFADNSLTIDSTRYPLGTSSGTRSATGTNIIIFGFRQDGYYGVGAKPIFRMESCEIKHGNDVVRNFIPALRKSDSKPGLYDLVSDTFFVNQNQTGVDFVYALESYKTYIPIYEKKKMIKNANGGMIDLGVIPGNNILIEFDGTVNPAMSGGADDGIFDTIAIGNGKICSLGIAQSSYLAYRCNGGWGRAANILAQERHIYSLQGGANGMTIYVDGTQVWHSNETIPVGVNCYLFGQYRHPATEIYTAKVYSDSTLYMDLIPIYDLKEKKVGLFDKIHYKPYISTTQGTYINLDDRTDSILFKNQTYHVDNQIHGYSDIVYIEQEVNE